MKEIIIVGAGPAGSSAALFAAKAGKTTLVIDNDKSITKKAWMDNHYGVDGISGPDLIETGKKQAEKFGAEYVEDTAVEIRPTDNGVVVATENGEYTGKHVILATGVLPSVAEKSGLKTTDGREPKIKTIYVVDADGRTNLNNVWAAGTCAGVSVHTIITAGDGAKVAINVISELNGERYVDHDVLK
ncbi:FAD-dependent oxidoreductase [Bacillus tianshenii]|nr:FAD-dependent oxidoreductase [Bacillus tianshenii]